MKNNHLVELSDTEMLEISGFHFIICTEEQYVLLLQGTSLHGAPLYVQSFHSVGQDTNKHL